MCQLLGMNCAAPTDCSFSFRGFCRRGGITDIHAHGWGLAIYEGKRLRTFLEPRPAARSPVAQLVSQHPIKTHNMMAHIRYATQGAVCLENVHPFRREMWGIQWCFAHNGDVPNFSNKHSNEYPSLGKSVERTYHPVGDTDSEAVFCAILNALQAEFSELPPLELLQESLRRLCDEISTEPHTIFNFLLACGQYTTFAYSWPGSRPGSKVWNGLWYLVREPPFSSAKLIDVVDYCATIEFAQVNTLSDRIAVITTKPLTNETGWKEFKRGELLMFDRGIPYSAPGNVSVMEREEKEKLCSKTFSLSSSPTGVEKLTNMLARTAI